MKVLRAVAGGHFGKLAFGSLEIFDLSEVGSGDPMCKLILEHWAMFQECVARNLPAANLVKRAWAVSWDKLARGKQRWSLAAGPIAAMQCYLMDLGFDASTMDLSAFRLRGAIPKVGTIVRQQLKQVLRKDRWNRIASQELANGAQDGIDWAVPRRMLKRANKQPLIASGLRMLWQGAIRRANHGGDLLCLRCGKENSLAHVLHECVRWGSFDLGRDPAWEAAYPNAPVSSSGAWCRCRQPAAP